jgi:hypothetical protein
MAHRTGTGSNVTATVALGPCVGQSSVAATLIDGQLAKPLHAAGFDSHQPSAPGLI